MSKSHQTHRYRTMFLSDLHLGTRGCQAHLILDVLRHVEADTIYLVGDIIDGWRLRSGWYWPQAHNDVIQKLLRKVRRGARMVFVPGNHDEFARQFFGLTFGGIEIKRQAIYTAADGKRYLIIHGDEFDVVVRHSKWLAFFGDWAYDFALFVNTHFNAARRALGLPYWSFSAWAKLKVKNAVNFIGSFERELAGEARKRGVDGVICGHIHHPVIRDMEGVIYVNIGDFVESCSLVVEHYDGRLEVLRWKDPLQVAARVEDDASFERGSARCGSRRGASGSCLMRILIATDAWRPQVNGVVSTLERMTQAATELGAAFEFLTPQGMWSAPLPSYPEIRLAIPSWRRIDERIEEAKPDHIHIATEGPIGWLTRRYCLRHKRIFTTSYHTRFPEYVSARVRVPEWLTYAGLRYFHAPSAAVMAPTPTIGADLTRRGFARVRLWTRGVNHAVYRPRPKRALDLPRPIFLSVGRVSVEKNLEALLSLDLPGSTVIVGDGPARRTSSAATAMRISSAPSRGKRWPTSMRAPTCSSFPRAPTRSGS